MDGLTTFDSTKELLSDILRSIRDGRIQLPDFQRGWVWDDEHIRSLLASVTLSYPIGAIMMLEAGGQDVRFKTRPVEGASPTSREAERLILDGQQRLTSLFQSLSGDKAVQTRDARGNELARWYYLNIQRAIDPNADRDEAIVAIPASRKVLNFRGEELHDYSTTEKECAAGLLPLSVIFDTARLTDWQMKYLQVDPSQMMSRLNTWNLLVQNVIQRVQQYQIPVIILRKNTPKDAVCQVFEKVNTGGVALTVFELLTATYAADEFHLRDDWQERIAGFKKHRVLHGLENTDFLQSISLLATHDRRQQAIARGDSPDNLPGISCKRRDILRLTLDEYRKWAPAAAAGFTQAAKLLVSQKIFASRDLPYRTQLPPMAAIYAALGPKAQTDAARSKLLRWYWSGVFGELYGGATESRIARDLAEVVRWVEGGAEPSTVTEANFVPRRLHTLRTRNSAAYKGLHALLLRDGGQDLRTGDPIDAQLYFDDAIDVHHVFPKAWCLKNGIDRKTCDSVVNKTPLSAKTNRMIGGLAPSSYLPKIQKAAGVETSRMNELLRTHLIDPSSLRKDDFEAFIRERQKSLLERIGQAMGKAILNNTATAGEDTRDSEEDDDDDVDDSILEVTTSGRA